MKRFIIFTTFLCILFTSLLPILIKKVTTNNENVDLTYKAIINSPNYKNEYKDTYLSTYEKIKIEHNFSNDTIINLTLNITNYPSFLSPYNDTKNYLLINNIPLVNRTFGLEKNFIPNNLVKVEKVAFIKRKNEEMLINENTLLAYQKLYEAAKSQNIDLIIFSAYRSYEKQMSLWEKSLDPNNKYLALPGHSEHQTGLAIDVSVKEIGLTNNFSNSKAYTFLNENIHKYGFIFRYPKDKTNITGYNYESWHLRYVGDIAREIKTENLTLEEYLYYHYEIPILQ